MKNEAKENEAADKTAKETAEKVNAADGLIFQTEKQLKEFDEKLSDGNKEAITAALATLKEAHAAQDLAKIDTAMEGLNNAWAAASQEIYDQGEAAGAQGQAQGADQQAQD